jgi:hypothetical protein
MTTLQHLNAQKYAVFADDKATVGTIGIGGNILLMYDDTHSVLILIITSGSIIALC